jgi:hypothetical protein
MYLPKTWPSHPVPKRESVYSPCPVLSVYKTVTLTPVWPDGACPVAKAKATMPTVQAGYTHDLYLQVPLCLPNCSYPYHLVSHSLPDIPFR